MPDLGGEQGQHQQGGHEREECSLLANLRTQNPAQMQRQSCELVNHQEDAESQRGAEEERDMASV